MTWLGLGHHFWLHFIIAKAASTQQANELFINSPGHKANILNPMHTSVGI